MAATRQASRGRLARRQVSKSRPRRASSRVAVITALHRSTLRSVAKDHISHEISPAPPPAPFNRPAPARFNFAARAAAAAALLAHVGRAGARREHVYSETGDGLGR